MTPAKIKEMVDLGAALTVMIETYQAQLKDIKKALATEAASRHDEHEPAGDNDGTVWNFRTDFGAVTVMFPTDTLKESINIDSKLFDKIEATVPETKLFSKLFERVHAVKPVSGFRLLIEEHLPKATAAKLLKLCTSASTPSVKLKSVAVKDPNVTTTT